jgi:hypothetical protein
VGPCEHGNACRLIQGEGQNEVHGNSSERSVHRSDLSPSLNRHPISKIAYEKRGNGKSCDVDTQGEHVLVAFSIVSLTHSGRLGGGGGGQQ